MTTFNFNYSGGSGGGGSTPAVINTATDADVTAGTVGKYVDASVLKSRLSGIAHTAITAIDLKATGTANEFVVEITWTDADGVSQTTTDPTPVVLSGGVTASTQIEVTNGTVVANTFVQPDTLKVELDKRVKTSNKASSTDIDNGVAGQWIDAALMKARLSGIAHTVITNIDFKATANPNEFVVEITWTDADGVSQTTTDPTPVVLSGGVTSATQAEVTAGTVVANAFVQPDTLKVELDKKVKITEKATGTDVDNKTVNKWVDAKVLSDKLSGIAHTAITAIDLKATGTANEFVVEITWTDADGVSQTTTDPTPVVLNNPKATASTQAEVTAGTVVANTFVQPDTLKVELDKKVKITEKATGTDVDNKTVNKWVDAKVLSDKLSGIAHTAITAIDLKATTNPNEFVVEITWTDADGVSQTTTDPTPVVLSGGVTSATQAEVTAGTVVANAFVQPDTLKVELDKKVNKVDILTSIRDTATATDVDVVSEKAISKRLVDSTNGEIELGTDIVFKLHNAKQLHDAIKALSVDVTFISSTAAGTSKPNLPTLTQVKNHASLNFIKNSIVQYTGTENSSDETLGLYLVDQAGNTSLLIDNKTEPPNALYFDDPISAIGNTVAPKQFVVIGKRSNGTYNGTWINLGTGTEIFGTSTLIERIAYPDLDVSHQVAWVSNGKLNPADTFLQTSQTDSKKYWYIPKAGWSAISDTTGTTWDLAEEQRYDRIGSGGTVEPIIVETQYNTLAETLAVTLATGDTIKQWLTKPFVIGAPYKVLNTRILADMPLASVTGALGAVGDTLFVRQFDGGSVMNPVTLPAGFYSIQNVGTTGHQWLIEQKSQKTSDGIENVFISYPTLSQTANSKFPDGVKVADWLKKPLVLNKTYRTLQTKLKAGLPLAQFKSALSTTGQVELRDYSGASQSDPATIPAGVYAIQNQSTTGESWLIDALSSSEVKNHYRNTNNVTFNNTWTARSLGNLGMDGISAPDGNNHYQVTREMVIEFLAVFEHAEGAGLTIGMEWQQHGGTNFQNPNAYKNYVTTSAGQVRSTFRRTLFFKAGEYFRFLTYLTNGGGNSYPGARNVRINIREIK